MDNMVRAREAANMSQTELSKRVAEWGVPCHQQTIARIEGGTRSIRLDEAQALTAILFAGSLEQALATSTTSLMASQVREDTEALDREVSSLEEDIARGAERIVNWIAELRFDVDRYKTTARADHQQVADEALLERAEKAIAQAEAVRGDIVRLQGQIANFVLGENQREVYIPPPPDAERPSSVGEEVSSGEHPEA